MTKFGIDLGHNCPYDGGAVGIRKENDLIKEVGLKIIKKLADKNHTVINCSPRSKVMSLRDSLVQRTNTANSNNVDIFVSVHFNAFNGKAYGTEVLYLSESGKRIARSVVNEISNLGFYNRGLRRRRDLHVLRATNMPAILIECCFCDNWKDMKLFDGEKMANAIVKGLT